jgi:nicotinate-nucleotide pyrophosphorylase (carboxylating)
MTRRIARTCCARRTASWRGRPWFDAVHRALDPGVRIDWRCDEGDHVGRGTVIATLQGRNRALVSAERASLNFLQTLSGTATTTAHYVDAVRGTGTKILDTRKTIPGLRLAQKYAVRVGGGMNHRIALYDAVMLKENHIRAFGSVAAAIARARALQPGLPLIVEVETLAQLREALDTGCTRILIDDFDADTRREAVRIAKGALPGTHPAGSLRRRGHDHAARHRRRRRGLHLDRRADQAPARDRLLAEAGPAAGRLIR